jgi:hypothetical protein
MSILGKAKTTLSAPPVRMWIYGEPDAGKTHFATSFPNALLLSTDGNYIYYPNVDANSLKSWEVGPLATNEEKSQAFINLLTYLESNNPYDTIVLDLAEGLYRLARNHYLKLLKIVDESDLGYGKAYKVIRGNFISALERLFKLPVNIIIISHQTVEKIEPKSASPYTVFKPNFEAKLLETVEGYCSLVGRVFKDVDEEGNEVRKLTLSPKDSEFGINRLGTHEDLILTHNGDNYGDFEKIWLKLFQERGLNQGEAKNVTRLTAEKDKKDKAKSDLADKIRRAKESSPNMPEEEKPSAKVEEPAETSTEPAKEGSVKDPEMEAKLAKIAALKAKKAESKKVEESEEAAKEEDPIGDGEPEVERTDSVKEKLAKIAALKAARAAKNK